MGNVRKIIIGVFCAGVFLTGLGTGIAFYEASSFTYMGEKIAGPVEMKTEVFECEFDLEENRDMWLERQNARYMSKKKIVPDPEVPETTLRFVVTYNAKTVEPYLKYEDGAFPDIRYYYIGDDFGSFMECKDQILKELKERKISSYRTKGIENIEILVNPADLTPNHSE